MGQAYDDSHAARWGLAPDVFQRACDAASAKGGPLPAHLADFALAVACREGCEPAWNHVMAEYGPRLQRAAAALDASGRAADLADELFADLYSQSLFRYFHGRSSLNTWLRAVLAQRVVDRLRAQRRTEPLIDDERVPAVVRAGGPDDSACRAAVRAALTQALDQLAARDRLVLGCYYSQGMKLAAIGRMLREHEATVSRHLTRIREALRVAIDDALRLRTGYDASAARECLQSVMNDAGDLDLTALIEAHRVQCPGVPKEAEASASALPAGTEVPASTARSTSEIVHTGRDRAAD